MKYSLNLVTAFFLLLITGLTTAGLAQNPYPEHTNCEREMKQAGKWYFGVFAGMDFTAVQPLPETTQPDVFLSPISPGLIADSAGNILFMTTGKQVFNKNFEMVAEGLFGHFSCTQPSIILPKPGDPSRYYVFTTDSYRNINGDKGLNYTLLHVDIWSGVGGLSSLNNNLIPEGMNGRLTATRHANGIDYWVIAHKWQSNEFCSFRLTGGGVDQNYVSSNTGLVHDDANNLLGHMKISPDGKRLAVALYESGVIEVFDFDAATGRVSNPVTSPPDFYGVYGLEFSPDASKLYITLLDYSNIIPAFDSELIQIDLDAPGIFSSAVSISTSDDGFRYAGLQLGLDGRVYMAKSLNAADHADHLGVVYNPNRKGLACNYNTLDGADQPFYLGGKESFWGLPNIVQSFVDWPHFTYDSVCVGDATIFRINNPANIDGADWDFGDPSGTSNTSDFLNPVHTFSTEGRYDVTVAETYAGETYSYTESVKVFPLPEVSFGADTIYIFKGDAATLSAGQWSGYEWSNGATSSEIRVTEPGLYWVKARNAQCCYNIDSVYVVQYDLHVPNAFRPASAVNNVFKPVVPFNAVRDYSLKIFDRWGQLVFESRDLGTGWNGEILGRDAPFGVYAWRIDYNTVSDDGTRPVKMSGTVMLLR